MCILLQGVAFLPDLFALSQVAFEDAYVTMTLSDNATRNNLKLAEKIRGEYFNWKTE